MFQVSRSMFHVFVGDFWVGWFSKRAVLRQLNGYGVTIELRLSDHRVTINCNGRRFANILLKIGGLFGFISLLRSSVVGF